jgi:hypothetical protein
MAPCYKAANPPTLLDVKLTDSTLPWPPLEVGGNQTSALKISRKEINIQRTRKYTELE